MTAKDVVYTFKRLIDPNVGSEALPILTFLKPEGIIAVDDYTVKFTTDKPVAELPAFLSTKNTRIVQEGATKETSSSPVWAPAPGSRWTSSRGNSRTSSSRTPTTGRRVCPWRTAWRCT